ncbi:MAG: (2Fe-2S) ferredoxin domain-containing protein [Bacteroidota bacterium]
MTNLHEQNRRFEIELFILFLKKASGLMRENANTITICMGSSCFSRGNKYTLKNIQSYLKEKELENSVTLRGAHCLGKCDKGPVLIVNDEEIFHVEPEKVNNLLDEKLKW